MVRETPDDSDHEVRDLLGHADISATSRCSGSTPRFIARLQPEL
jgi:hypothetical protein